ncbi:hypothetical protein AMAG_17314 [Allomyces macrogynus ATCC 38327]|uniref:Uncharacterized protein n=1 Tax=Allomyces macrogynus (strain ATCC 38327) TaxID=578462 RepID=A0A0L0TEE2_ALLM3|nr:hypothetical protein AMAG_17314 [Allomyces macrogynus ATCC 38327]|eukprot:KNE73045.1 hypothetical protein AMAG_17314 [Allomyces macrogynus ATCC 38327]
MLLGVACSTLMAGMLFAALAAFDAALKSSFNFVPPSVPPPPERPHSPPTPRQRAPFIPPYPYKPIFRDQHPPCPAPHLRPVAATVIETHGSLVLERERQPYRIGPNEDMVARLEHMAQVSASCDDCVRGTLLQDATMALPVAVDSFMPALPHRPVRRETAAPTKPSAPAGSDVLMPFAAPDATDLRAHVSDGSSINAELLKTLHALVAAQETVLKLTRLAVAQFEHQIGPGRDTGLKKE